MANHRNDGSVAWRKRSPEVHAMFEKIDAWLASDKSRKFNTSYYDLLVKQWLEFGQLNDKQIQTLRNIIERCITK